MRAAGLAQVHTEDGQSGGQRGRGRWPGSGGAEGGGQTGGRGGVHHVADHGGRTRAQVDQVVLRGLAEHLGGGERREGGMKGGRQGQREREVTLQVYARQTTT